MLKGTSVKVLEIAPLYVQTELGGPEQAKDPRAMPLNDFIDETMRALATDNHEILVDKVMDLRKGAGRNDNDATTKLNDLFAAH